MNFSLTEEQESFRDATRKFLREQCHSTVIRDLEKSESGFSEALWKQMVELGWTGIIVPEQYGGSELGFLELGILLEEIGAAAFDSPFFANLMATLAILEGGSDKQKKQLVSAIASGESIISLAVEELGVAYEPRFISTSAQISNNKYIINGSKLFVAYPNVADYLLVLARTSGVTGDEQGCSLILVDSKTPGISMTPLNTIAPDRQFKVNFDNVTVASDSVLGDAGKALTTIGNVYLKCSALICAEMVGGAAHQLAATAEYTKQRVQFDRPLGSFQAVQHHLSDMFTLVQGSRWASYQAIDQLNRNRPADREVTIAKAFTSDACQRVAALTHQLHGGVGVDMANDLQFYFRRAKAMELKFGPTPVHLKRLGDQL